MEIRCPNCAAPCGAFDTRPLGPLSCTNCGKIIYLPQGEFPVVVAATFPAQQAAAIALTPFFHAEPVRIPPELSESPIGDTLELPPNDETAPPADETIDPSNLNATLDDGDDSVPTVMATAIVEPGDDNGDGQATAQNGDGMELLNLAGGSFAAALTPPPMPKAAADAEHSPALSEMSTLGPPPWDTEPPPLQGKPPPIPAPRQDPEATDDFALELGLPPLPELSQSDLVPLPTTSAVAAEAAEEERRAASAGNRTMWIAAAVALAVGIATAVVIVRVVMKRTEVPVVDPSVRVPSGSAASAPVEQKNEATPSKTAPLNPQKRAEAIEHYNKGNELYKKRKYNEALTEYKRALEADASFAYAHRGLGVTYAQQGKNEKAIDSYKMYVQLAPDAKDAGAVRDIIKKSER